MIKIHRRISRAVTMLTLTALVMTGCTSEASNIGKAKEKDGKTGVVDTGFTLSTVGSYDSADTAVVLSTDPERKAVTLINMNTGKQYTLYYDGTTYVQNKHDGPMTISQIEAGDVVDVTFLKGKKKLASIKLSPEAWVFDEINNYDLTGVNRTASIGSKTYSLPEGVVVLSEGRRVDKAEVVSQDVVTISGIDHEIYSVSVEKGHGYLRLKNEQALLGGWIEVGNKVIRQITEDMLLVVPEGSYQVMLTNKNVGCVKDVTVERDKEVVLDVGDLEIAEDAVGRILFTVTPENAKVSVDGKPVDISKVVEIPYGIHQIQAQASGYDTLTKHIQVGSEYATISFKLEESRKAADNNSSDKDSVSGNTSIPEKIPYQDTMDSVEKPKNTNGDTLTTVSENALGTSNNYKVYIDSPKGVEVYLDDDYVGISPVRFTKIVGKHEITLKKSGYKTKTYSIYLENTKQDETFSFSDLEKEGSSSTTNKNIPKVVTGAVSNLAECKITDGTDVYIDTASASAILYESGIEKVKTAIENAVIYEVGKTQTDNYNFTVADILTGVIPPGDKEGKGTVSITISREGYKEQKVSCNIIIVKKEEETPSAVAKGKVAFTITPAEAKEKIIRVILNKKDTNDKKDINIDETVELDYGTYEINIEAEGYQNFNSSFEVNSEEREPFECILQAKQVNDQNPDNKDDENKKDPDGENDENKNNPETPNAENPPEGSATTPTSPEPENQNKPGIGTDGNGQDNTNIPDNSRSNTTESDSQEENNNSDENNDSMQNLTTETVEINQNAHPIRKFFSSLFK